MFLNCVREIKIINHNNNHSTKNKERNNWNDKKYIAAQIQPEGTIIKKRIMLFCNVSMLCWSFDVYEMGAHKLTQRPRPIQKSWTRELKCKERFEKKTYDAEIVTLTQRKR